MALYDYEHEGKGCKLGKTFEWEQSVNDDPLKQCPVCKKPVKRLISAPSLSFPKGDSELRSQGFSKLVRRDRGLYENVTAQDGESRMVDLQDESTYPSQANPKKKRG